ncbi:hypothetical protein F4821DRAFT_254613 [Hypoxylon rubiginosum]|uniref:Uncharacterized protein n=1 Tax=Hypoxylon rubiginosum TaxID=110542 RepID=A0ACC0DGC8_9PEZI|nr:hypothetical protein F4821DRAFT_254613 [Hypoxylon rubiginosum]
MADVYRRTGRGGAGNFYSQKDIAEATKAADSSKDLEAQKQQQQQPAPADEIPTDPADAPAQNATLAPGAYARTGRGGAGNFVDPISVAAAQTSSSASTTSPPTSPTSSTTPAPAVVARNGLSGRGGAGNWTTVPGEGEGQGESEEGGVYDPEQERKRREALDAHILKDIRDSLPQPPKIHYMHGPGRGRKPEPSPATS